LLDTMNGFAWFALGPPYVVIVTLASSRVRSLEYFPKCEMASRARPMLQRILKRGILILRSWIEQQHSLPYKRKIGPCTGFVSYIERFTEINHCFPLTKWLNYKPTIYGIRIGCPQCSPCSLILTNLFLVPLSPPKGTG